MSELEFPQARFLPWQQSQKERLQQQIAAFRLPHALLFSGVADIGKKNFAFALGAQLLCNNPEKGQACENCSACLLVRAGTHPDLRVVRPEESKLIIIEQIRSLSEWAAQTSQQGGRKVAILYPAEQMNVNSANALLKSLEEPAPGTFFILVTDQPGRLLPTIRSRSQRIEFPVPREEEAIPWLQSNYDASVDVSQLLAVAAGAPLKVVNQFDDDYLLRRANIVKETEGLIQGRVMAVAAASSLFKKDYPLEVYDILYQFFSDALRLNIAGSEETLKNNDMLSFINVIYRMYDATTMLLVLDAINASRVAIKGSSNPNQQLLLESLMIKLAEMVHTNSGY
ncbi:MAG: DNA polymerase III subunit delta' [Gammaproteobacteria bacterium]|jgi:DNA polymerase-3 subunit delta'|nr:DNA polymerase III subunit delta' [Gammaproteobacteria bacterium]|tara:strand:+ start:385 stop:1404 length:1020 start_codon:yes stop_codon:yes gene_type:complete